MSSSNGTSIATTPSASTSIDTSSIASAVSSSVSSALQSSSSTPPPTTSSQQQTSTSVPPTSSAPPSTTTFSASTRQATTEIATSVVLITPTGTEAPSSIVVTVTAVNPATTFSASTAVVSHTSSTTSGGAALNTGGSGSGGSSSGLSTAGVTAIAVVVPVAAVAVLVLAGIFLWRKRKQKKAAEEARRKEVEDYGFNPNNDPTLPAVASESGHEMMEDNSGYRGWGAATASSRKMSTTLSGGHTQGQLSDVGSSAYRGGPNSPTHGSDGNSGDPLVNGGRRETMNSDDIGALGQAPVAGAGFTPGMKRGPSNASSTYSAGGAPSETSDSVPPNGLSQSYEAYNPNTGFGYSQHGPYGDGSYGGGADAGMPIVRDVSARRNTRIQQGGSYQQGNSGISQNF